MRNHRYQSEATNNGAPKVGEVVQANVNLEDISDVLSKTHLERICVLKKCDSAKLRKQKLRLEQRAVRKGNGREARLSEPMTKFQFRDWFGEKAWEARWKMAKRQRGCVWLGFEDQDMDAFVRQLSKKNEKEIRHMGVKKITVAAGVPEEGQRFGLAVIDERQLQVVPSSVAEC